METNESSSLITIIDCSNIEKNIEDFAQKLGKGIETAGFVYLTNHGIRNEIIEKLRFQTKNFFNLPEDVRKKYTMRDPIKNFFGFTPANIERVGELDKTLVDSNNSDRMTEAFDFSGPDAKDIKKYPTEIPNLKLIIDEFRESFLNLTKTLLRAFATYLNLDDREQLVRMHTAGFNFDAGAYNIIRSLLYLPQTGSNNLKTEKNEGKIRLGEHCDWGSITFLLQDEIGGLEAKLKNGEWISVPPIPGSIVLNSGLMLEFWSGGRLVAVPHRVRSINSNTTSRHSILYFIQPDGHVRLSSLVPKLNNWTSSYNIQENESSAEFFEKRVKAVRNY